MVRIGTVSSNRTRVTLRLSTVVCWRQRLAILWRLACSSRIDTAWICGLLKDNSPALPQQIDGRKGILHRRFRFNPYGRGEIYYDSRYDKVSRTSLIAVRLSL